MDKKLLNKLANDQPTRIALATNSHKWFFGYYFREYIKHDAAPFHDDFFEISEDMGTPLHIVMAFRGSAKSSILTTSYPIWSILGKQQMKFVLIASHTQNLARAHLASIRRELESNELLKADLGPFKEESDEWGSYSIVLPKHDARITAVSTEQAVRGLRHGSHRPQLVICDDVENMDSVKTAEGRNKTFDWFTKELLPAGDSYTKAIVVGNLLHEDSLLMRYMDKIDNKESKGQYLTIPIRRNSKILWPGKFPDEATVKKEKMRIGDARSWEREYMLKIVPDEAQVIKRKWIHCYDELPDDSNKSNYMMTGIGVDLAISLKSHADYTAMIVGHLFKIGGKMKLYIEPQPVNKRLEAPDQERLLKELASSTPLYGKRSRLFIEDVAYQKSLIQRLKDQGYQADGYHPQGTDKYGRLSSIAPLVSDGTILFPKNGVEKLLAQLVDFGVEKHDDLADALAVLVLKAQEVFQDSKKQGTAHFGKTNMWNRREGEPVVFKFNTDPQAGRINKRRY